MLSEILTAGFGGQGILFLGDVLTRAALGEGKHVTYLPTYGVAMRGGTANCVVTIANQPVGSPLLDRPNVAIILNEPSLVKFQPMVRQGGLIIANSSMIDQDAFNRPDDLRIVWVPATEMARDVAGTERSTNMIVLGAFLAIEPVVKLESVESILRKFATGAKKVLLDKNLAAIRAGMDHAESSASKA